MNNIHTLDFENHKIESMPHYPPKPVSMGLRYPSGKKEFLAWGHPDGNNCRFQDAKRVLTKLAKDPSVVFLFHNAGFEMEVMREHFEIPYLPQRRWHDTLFLLFLDDPRAYNLSLKPSAERLLGRAPTPQQKLRDYILQNVVKRKSYKEWGGHIADCPGTIVKPYCLEDVADTWAIFKRLWSSTNSRGMMPAYETEKSVQYEVFELERGGIRFDAELLAKEAPIYEEALEKVEKRLRRKLGDINYGSPQQLADALDAGGYIDEWSYTKKGNRSTKAELLEESINDPRLQRELMLRSKLSHMMANFCRPWLERWERTGEPRLYPRFNAVRDRSDEGGGGTRTGRFSSSDPNAQQMNREPDEELHQLIKEFLPKSAKIAYPYPWMRRYILPEEGHILIGRDFAQQELRILAHYEEGELFDLYMNNPDADVHDYVMDLVHSYSTMTFDRPAIKRINFGKVYGMGVPKLARQAKIPREVAFELNKAHRKALPGIQDVNDTIKDILDSGDPIRTIGGREYYAEPPLKDDHGRVIQNWYYKMLNVLIQGGAADHSKRALIRIGPAVRSYDGRLLLTQHDEFLATVPIKYKKPAMKSFQHAMDFKYFDVPTPSDGKTGMTWGTMEKWKDES